MDSMAKTKLKSQVVALSAVNNQFKSLVGIQPPPVVGGMPPVPINVAPAFAPLLAALKLHADEFDKLLKVVNEIIDKS